jgi:hypothetical protein
MRAATLTLILILLTTLLAACDDGPTVWVDHTGGCPPEMRACPWGDKGLPACCQ